MCVYIYSSLSTTRDRYYIYDADARVYSTEKESVHGEGERLSHTGWLLLRARERRPGEIAARAPEERERERERSTGHA